MLTTASGSIPEIEQIIKELIREEFAFEQHNRRSVTREHFVRPAAVQIADNAPFLAFSKNFSKDGIGLITNCEIAEGRIATISIYRLKESPVEIQAECRWCKTYGPSWFLSGWRFRSIAR